MAMENGGLSASDALLLGGGGAGGFGGNSFMWIFGLLILMGMMNGGFGGWGANGFANAIGYENLATSNEVQRGFDAQNSMANQREILAAVNSGTAQAVAATNQTFHDTLGIIQNRYDELARDVASLAVGQANQLAKSAECCCETKQLIQQSNYDGAMRDAATNANLTAQIQSVKDMIAQDKIESLQSQVSQLQLAQATAGVLRFPNQWSYGAGPFPPIFGGCGCNA
jgi:hypothetical protein